MNTDDENGIKKGVLLFLQDGVETLPKGEAKEG